MDYTQRHQAGMDTIRKDFDENEDEALKVPNFLLMEKFLVVGGNDPCLFFNNKMKAAYPANKKKSSNAIGNLRKELDVRRLNCEFQEEAEGLFGLMKHNNSEDKNVNRNWLHKTVLNCGAIQFPSSTEELFAITKVRHLNFLSLSFKLTSEKKQKIFLWQLLSFGLIKRSRFCLKKKSTNFYGVILVQI
jgi:hypothetical protein